MPTQAVEGDGITISPNSWKDLQDVFITVEFLLDDDVFLRDRNRHPIEKDGSLKRTEGGASQKALIYS